MVSSSAFSKKEEEVPTISTTPILSVDTVHTTVPTIHRIDRQFVVSFLYTHQRLSRNKYESIA
jgi:hypothetical protein